MKEFAHSQGQFEGWKGNEELRRAFFSRAVKLIVEARAKPIGAIVSLSAFRSLTDRQRSNFLDPYYIAFQTCTRGAAIAAVFEPPDEQVSMVYSYQSQYGTNNNGRAEQLWQAMKKGYEYGNRMGSYSSGFPGNFCPLQAADLFAYELSHEFENRVKRPDDKMRWGLRQILGMYRIPILQIRFYDRKELLRVTKESHFPDQTSVEEVENTQMKSAQESMMKWFLGRGQFTADHFADFIDAMEAIE